jgi:L-alanine-DL-glutamate epimerase-like enolase superfamily enzyme
MDQRLATVRANQCSQFSTKASGNLQADINFINELGYKMRSGESVKIGAKHGWRVDEAISIMRATENVNAFFEQPCWSYEDCRSVRQACGRPFVFDECLLDSKAIVRAWNDGVCDVINLKIGRVGGITPALEMRDLCIELGIPMHIQCTGGSNITQVAIVHLAQSMPTERLLVDLGYRRSGEL